jgi:hypothetical protein
MFRDPPDYCDLLILKGFPHFLHRFSGHQAFCFFYILLSIFYVFLSIFLLANHVFYVSPLFFVQMPVHIRTHKVLSNPLLHRKQMVCFLVFPLNLTLLFTSLVSDSLLVIHSTLLVLNRPLARHCQSSWREGPFAS